MSNMKPEIRLGEFTDDWEQRKFNDKFDNKQALPK